MLKDMFLFHVLVLQSECPPKTDILTSSPLVHQKVTVFGNRVFLEVINLK